MMRIQKRYPYGRRFHHNGLLWNLILLRPVKEIHCLGEDETVKAGLLFNPVEFDEVKIGIVKLFPYTQKLKGISIPQPVSNPIVRMFRVLGFCNISKANKTSLIYGFDSHLTCAGIPRSVKHW